MHARTAANSGCCKPSSHRNSTSHSKAQAFVASETQTCGAWTMQQRLLLDRTDTRRFNCCEDPLQSPSQAPTADGTAPPFTLPPPMGKDPKVLGSATADLAQASAMHQG